MSYARSFDKTFKPIAYKLSCGHKKTLLDTPLVCRTEANLSTRILHNLTMKNTLKTECFDNKFVNPEYTAEGEPRAQVTLSELSTLWFNTGTICNLTCTNCFMESSPVNDDLSFLKLDEVETFLNEIEDLGLPTREIGFTGGEPFINPDLISMLELCLSKKFRVLVLTNAMKPMMKTTSALEKLRQNFHDNLVFRISIDHYDKRRHEMERGIGTWEASISGLIWLLNQGFECRVAGRRTTLETEEQSRLGYAKLFAAHSIHVNAQDPEKLVLFPEMDLSKPTQEISTACLSNLNVEQDQLMCSNSRMVIRRKNTNKPTVVACTLITQDRHFELGSDLARGSKTIALNHPFCAQFCVLGGATCSNG